MLLVCSISISLLLFANSAGKNKGALGTSLKLSENEVAIDLYDVLESRM
jgi:hypothetical protein